MNCIAIIKLYHSDPCIQRSPLLIWFSFIFDELTFLMYDDVLHRTVCPSAMMWDINND